MINRTTGLVAGVGRQGRQPGWRSSATDGPASWGTPQPPAPLAPTPKKKGGCLRVGLIILAVLVVLLVIGGIIGAISGGKDDKTASGTTTTAAPGTPTTAKGSASPPFTDAASEAGRSDQDANSGALFPGRVDAQSKDRESSVPGAVRMEGRTVVVTAAGFEQSISEFETNGYLKASVTIVNRDPTAQAYNIFDWRLQTPSGTVLSPTFTTGQALGSGDLVTGGVVAGDPTSRSVRRRATSSSSTSRIDSMPRVESGR